MGKLFGNGHRLLGTVALAAAVAGLWRLSAAGAAPAGPRNVLRAVAVLQPVGNSGVTGTIHFVQQGSAVQVTGTLRGLRPGQHGFHVHEFGDLTDMVRGQSVGDHYNPAGAPHGAPTARRRHVGDLGNVTANASGVATVRITDRVIRLNGQHSILGRAVVVHANPDRFTQPSGDAGGRLAFGVIGIAQPPAR